MFGYVRPLKPELKVLEYEQYKACYCALCHCLGECYGLFSRAFLSYDFVFLAMLLWEDSLPVEYKREACVTNPFKKCPSCTRNELFELCAGYSVILTYWKLRDSASDDAFGKAAASGVSAALLKGAYRKAAGRYAEFDELVRANLDELAALESANEPSIDKAADRFAALLAGAAAHIKDEARSRVISQLLYHTGRWIYISDAVNDIKKDCERQNYNPIALKFGITDGVLSENTAAELKLTLTHSLNDISAAFSLMPENPWHGILKNIIYLGMPEVTRQVFAGEYEDIDYRLHIKK